jgi:hypothetical protein
VIHLYSGIARRKADTGDGIIVSRTAAHAASDRASPETDEAQIDNCEQPETESGAAPTT